MNSKTMTLKDKPGVDHLNKLIGGVAVEAAKIDPANVTQLAVNVATGTVTELNTGVAVVEGFGDYANQGFDGTTKDDLAIPFLAILQSGSPQCKRSDGKYIEGAAEGMLLNTVTNELIDPSVTPLTVIACAYSRALIEWRLREAGGGFVKEHPTSYPEAQKTERDDKNRDILPNGNQINDTRTFYVLVVSDTGGSSPAVITMTSTQIKKSKQWLMQQNLLRLSSGGKEYCPPMFASKWRVETVPESNDKGSWMGWKFTFAGYLAGVSDPLFVAALDFHKAITSGAVKADMAKMGEAADDTAAVEGDGDDEIPF